MDLAEAIGGNYLDTYYRNFGFALSFLLIEFVAYLLDLHTYTHMQIYCVCFDVLQPGELCSGIFCPLSHTQLAL